MGSSSIDRSYNDDAFQVEKRINFTNLKSFVNEKALKLSWGEKKKISQQLCGFWNISRYDVKVEWKRFLFPFTDWLETCCVQKQSLFWQKRSWQRFFFGVLLVRIKKMAIFKTTLTTWHCYEIFFKSLSFSPSLILNSMLNNKQCIVFESWDSYWTPSLPFYVYFSNLSRHSSSRFWYWLSNTHNLTT
jgi:hypothetical protein